MDIAREAFNTTTQHVHMAIKIQLIVKCIHND